MLPTNLTHMPYKFQPNHETWPILIPINLKISILKELMLKMKSIGSTNTTYYTCTPLQSNGLLAQDKAHSIILVKYLVARIEQLHVHVMYF